MSTSPLNGNSPDPTIRAEQNAQPPVDPDALARAGSSAAQQSMTGLPNVSLKEAIVSEEFQAMLRAAGLQKTSTGEIAVLDSKATLGVSDLKNTEQVYGTGETQLSPAAPPPVTLNAQTAAGAQAFAENMDLAMNNYLLTQADNGTQPLAGTEAGLTAVGDGKYFIRGVGELSADDLLAAFLKVNITDPNNSTETHNKLHQIASTMRQQAIAEAKKKIERAQEMRKEAEQYAQQAEYIMTIVQVASMAAAVFTMGSSVLAAQAASQAAQQAAQQTAQQVIQEASRNAAQQVARMSTDQMRDQLIQQGLDQTLASTMSRAQLQPLVQQNLTNQLASQMAPNMTEQAMQNVLQHATEEQLQTQLGSQWQEKIMNQMGDQVASQVQEQLAQQTQTVVQENVQASMQEQMQQVMTDSLNEQMSQAAQNAAENAAQQSLTDQGANAAVDPALHEAYTSGLDTQLNGNLLERGVMKGQSIAGEANSAIKKVGMATQAGGSIINAGAEYQMAMNEADIAEMRNDAKRWEFVGDLHQDQVEEQGQIMKEIMESKNQTVDAVMSMMNASFVSKQKLMAANMVR